ncbi:MAG: AAA family ATPase [Muribaculaceae bacterium]|nr:AAA family ATPase [Muribaculaceae bacterium]
MSINITSNELTKVLDTTPARHNIMLVGRHGIGKSQILTSYYAAKGMKVIALFLGQMSDPGDLIGLPHKDEQTGKTEFLPPYWFPVDGKPIVLFLDELNRARPEVLQTVMDLVLNRKLAGRPLPEGSRIISAVNDGEEYQLTDLDPALVSRFNIYTFRPTPEEWLLWAEKNGIDPRIINFLSDHANLLDGDNHSQLDRGLEKMPDRRAWERVSDIFKDVDTPTLFHQKLVAGIIGVTAAAVFFKEFRNNDLPKANLVLFDFENQRSRIEKLEIDKIAIINEDIMRYLETKELAAKDEAAVKYNLVEYINYLRDNKKEGMAHFVSLIESDNYPKAVGFIAMNLPEAYMTFATFIHNI